MVSSSFAQTLGLNYQAIIRDTDSELLRNTAVLMRLNFREGDTNLYTEEHTITSDGYGQISFVIGTGSILNGSFETIPWEGKNVFLYSQIFHGGQWIDLGQQEFQSVPYTYYSDAAGKAYRSTVADSAFTAEQAESYVGNTLEIGTATRLNGSTFLTVKGTNPSGYNGMYIDAPVGGSPFYGFANGGIPQAWIYYNPALSELIFNNSANTVRISESGLRLSNLNNRLLEVDASGNVQGSTLFRKAGVGAAINGTTQIGSASFTVHSTVTGTSYGGMYVNTTSATGSPFYGYAQNGSPKAWHYYNADAWKLNISGDKLTVTSDGRMGVNTTNPVTELHLVQRDYDKIDNPSDDGVIYRHTGLRLQNNSDGTRWVGVSCSSVGYVMFHSNAYRTGVLASIHPVTGAYEQNSDSTLKKNIKPLGSVLDKVMELKPTEYEFKAGENSYQLGFLAQEVQEVFPSMVHNNGETLSISYSEFSAIAIKAIQEQETHIAELKVQQETYRLQIQELNEKINQLQIK